MSEPSQQKLHLEKWADRYAAIKARVPAKGQVAELTTRQFLLT